MSSAAMAHRRSLSAAACAMLTVIGACAAAAQNSTFVGTWSCEGTVQGARVIYQVTLQPNGVYTGTYETSTGYRSYSQGPYRLIGDILRFDFQVWQTFPQQTTNPGGDGYYYQFQGQDVLLLAHYRCPQNPDCSLMCRRSE